MADRGRFIFDTNVVVSALLMKKSVARDALDKARTSGEILLALEVIEELHDVLSRPAFDRYIDEENRLKFLSLLVKEAALIEITERINEISQQFDTNVLDKMNKKTLELLMHYYSLIDEDREVARINYVLKQRK